VREKNLEVSVRLYPRSFPRSAMSVPKSKGQKNDRLDAFGLAEMLPIVVEVVARLVLGRRGLKAQHGAHLVEQDGTPRNSGGGRDDV
jgi:hypothetical protein